MKQRNVNGLIESMIDHSPESLLSTSPRNNVARFTASNCTWMSAQHFQMFNNVLNSALSWLLTVTWFNSSFPKPEMDITKIHLSRRAIEARIVVDAIPKSKKVSHEVNWSDISKNFRNDCFKKKEEGQINNQLSVRWRMSSYCTLWRDWCPCQLHLRAT